MSRLPTLSPIRIKIYQYIVEFKQNHDGNSPTIAEIMKVVEVNSSSVVRYYLDSLEQLGMIKRSPRDARMISVVGGTWTTPAELSSLLDARAEQTHQVVEYAKPLHGLGRRSFAKA